MSAKSSKGLKICITKGAATPTAVVPTAVSTGAPAEVTVAAVTGITKGDVVFVTKTGYPEIDGKMFVVGDVDGTANTFELLGSDTTGTTGTLDGAPSIQHYVAGDMTCLCLASLSINRDTPSVVSTSTYCDPSSSIPSAVVSAGTLDFSGYVNINDADYKELLLAVEDGKQRYLRIMLPDNGYIVAPVTFSSMTWSLPIDGAVGYDGSAVLGSAPKHLF